MRIARLLLIPALALSFVWSATPSQASAQQKAAAPATPQLPQLSAVVATPSGALPGGTQIAVPRVVTLSAAVTNPTSMDKGSWCEMTVGRAPATHWTRTGGSYVNGTCTFASVQLPPGGPGGPGGVAVTELNVRGCNAAGCKESPVWLQAVVDARPPTVTHAITAPGLGPQGDQVEFSEPLGTAMQQQIEAAISAAADHPVKFAWRVMGGVGAGAGRQPQTMAVTVTAVQTAVHFRQSVALDLVDLAGNVTPGAKIIELASAVAAAPLPQLSAVAVTPGTIAPAAQGVAHGTVPRTVTLSAAVTNPSSMEKDGWCEMSLARSGQKWSRTGGSYASGTCTFASVQLPPSGPAGRGGAPGTELNVRGCNSAGCKESPVWLEVTVDAQPPRVLHAIDHAGLGPNGEDITFDEELSPSTQQQVEAAISAAADHPVKFAWHVFGTSVGSHTASVNVKSVQTAASLRQSVTLDLTDLAGNVTHAAKLVDLPAATAAALPQLSGVVATPSAPLPGGAVIAVARATVFSATVTNPTAMEKGGWCELTFGRRAGPNWSRTGGSYANGTCTFASVPLPLPGPGGVATELNVRGCNAAGCKESPVWLQVEVDTRPPMVTHAITAPALGPQGDQVEFSEPLGAAMQQQIEAAISAAADHPVKFAWRVFGAVGAATGRQPPTSAVTVTAVQTAVHFRQSVTLDLADPVGNVTHGAKLIALP